MLRLFRAGCVLLLVFCQTAAAADTKVSLRLFIWEDYFPQTLISDFTAKYGVSIEQVYYETDELKDETLINTGGGQGLDIIVGSRASFREYVKYGWLAKYPAARMENLAHIEKRWLPSGPLEGYSLPYLWGTVGIAYRSDKVPHKLSQWSDLFKPDPALQQRIMMTNDSRDTIGLALKSLGKSVNANNPDDLKAAEALLLAQKPFVREYSYPELDESSKLITGDIWVSLIYNGDAITLKELNEHIEFVVPATGTNLWIDDIAVLKQSKQQEHAWQFIDFINQPKNAALIAQHLYHASPNLGATPHLEKSFLEDPRIYPSQQTIDNSEFFEELSAQQLKKRNDIFLRVTK